MPSHPSPFERPQHTPPKTAAESPLTIARKQAVIRCLKQVIAQPVNNNIVDLGMVRNLRIVDSYVYLKLYVGAHQLALKDQTQLALGDLSWCQKAYIQLCTIPKVRTTLAVCLLAPA
ncbi:MAG: iron-sulfur cluster assembly protein [Cyanobacteria bacterium J06607_13]